MSGSPILLLDVDGVLNAVSLTDPLTWTDWKVTRANGFPIRWSPSMIAALGRLSDRVELRWLTTWWQDTHHLDFLGLPPMEVANTREEYLDRDGAVGSWWKLRTAQRVYAEGRPVIWIDDDLSYDQAAREWGRSQPPGSFLGISPNTFRGLEPEHLTVINDWLDEHVTAPADRCRCGDLREQHTPTCQAFRPVGIGSTPPGFRQHTERCRCLGFVLWKTAEEAKT